jgi:hypothetical protein
VRLAKSSPPCGLLPSTECAVREALAYIKNITTFKELLESGHTEELARTMRRHHSPVLAGLNSGSENGVAEEGFSQQNWRRGGSDS